MEWYREDVDGVIAHRDSLNYSPETVFYGSSTIRLWNSLYTDFADFKPAKLGFGGSTLAACAWFFDEIIGPFKQVGKFFLYAGDNDLGDGRRAEEVCLFYRCFLQQYRKKFKQTPLYFISIKPSVERQDILDEIKRANKLIENEISSGYGNEFFVNVFDGMLTKKGTPVKTYFGADGLHLSKKGYDVFKKAILKELNKTA